MKMNVYCVFDRASGVYDRPWCMHSDPAAIRSFTDISQDADHPIGKHPEDFTLFRIGEWHDDRGELIGSPPEKVIGAAEAYAAARKIMPGQLDMVGSMGDN